MALSPQFVFGAEPKGIVTGSIGNVGTGNLLEGARVEIPALNKQVLTDGTGQYVLRDIGPGEHEVVVSLLGYDQAKKLVVVPAQGPQRVVLNFDLHATVHVLSAFTVSTEREGGAAAMVAERNADNLKSVVSTDSFGNVPNLNPLEVAIRLPGVTGTFSDEGNTVAFEVRGVASNLNTITVDGTLVSTQTAMSRVMRMHNLAGSMFEQVEVIKGHTPDKGADSLGGTINLKSRSPLSMREKRRFSYNFSARLAPSFTEQIPLREEHRIHPLLNAGYQEVFSVLGGERNLGVDVNLYYSELSVGSYQTNREFQNTPTSPAYVWDYRMWDNYNNRKNSSANVKLDYRLSSNTKLTFNTLYTDAIERFRLRYTLRAFTNQTVGTSATAGIAPGYTDRVTEVRAVPASTIEVTSQMAHFYNRLRHFDLGAEHDFGRLRIDYNTVYSQTHINSGNGDGGSLVNRVTNAGWVLDRSESNLYPKLIPTGGVDWTNPANYRPSSLTFNDGGERHTVREARLNGRYKFASFRNLSVKTGVRWRREEPETFAANRQFSYLGTSALPSDPTIQLHGQVKTGTQIPVWNANAISVGRNPVNPSLWQESAYFNEQSKITGTRGVVEDISAGYVMAQGKIGHTSFLAGVRTEKTEDRAWGSVRTRYTASATERLLDPVGSVQREYLYRKNKGSYTKSFPSAHAVHDITQNIKARLSWSTSFGRPAFSNLVPNETVNVLEERLTISNPGLLPQYSENWDASLSWYFEPVGNLSVGWFSKSIKDYIVTGIENGIVGSGADNGYNGEYSGYTIFTSMNAGNAEVRGWEFSYRQQLNFLPGLLRGFDIFANYTLTETEGNFGGRTNLSTGRVAGFKPRTGNVGLHWAYRAFDARVLVNHTGSWLSSYSAATPANNLYVEDRTAVNFGVAYKLRPWMRLTCDVTNVFNEPQTLYRGYSDRVQSVIKSGTLVIFGVAGRF